MNSESATRFIPLLGMTLFVALGFGWRGWRQYRLTGSSGIFLFRSHSWVQHLREAGLFAVVLALVGQAVSVAFYPGGPTALGLSSGTPSAVRLVAGSALLFGGVVLMLAAQLDMGASWRVGFDYDARPGLVTNGFYAFCRNPIYLAVFATLAGFTLLVPTWLSIVVSLGTIIGIRNQVLEEEAFLRRTYGDSYREYAQRVGRFLPGLGRLA